MLNKVKYRIVLLFLVFPLYSIMLAQDQLLPVYNFQHLEGLRTDQIRSRVVRDHEGYIWIGTINGLNRYDGYGIKEYRHDPDDPHSISSNTVESILVDSKNRLWVGTYDTGLSLYDAKHDRFINFLPRRGDSLWYESSSIWGIIEDYNGNPWLATNHGVVLVEIPTVDESMSFDSLASHIRFTTYPLGTPRNTPFNMCLRDDGMLIVPSDRGLFLMEPTSRKLSRAQFSDSIGQRLNSLILNCVIRDSREHYWIGPASEEGLFRIDWEKNKVWNYRHKRGNYLSQRSEKIYDMVEDSNGNIWIGSGEWVYLFSPQTCQYIPYLTVDASLSRPSALIWLSIDYTGNLWIGLAEGGVHWLNQKSKRFFRHSLQDGTGSSPISFNTVERDKNGNCWLFSSKGVLYQVDINALKIVKTIDVFKGKQPTYSDCASFIDARGIYWYGTWGLGLFRIDLTSGDVSNYSFGVGLNNNRTVLGIAQCSGDTLWTATYDNGQMKFDMVSGRFIPFSETPNLAFTVMRDHLGKVWTTNESNGIIVLDPITGKKDHFFHEPSNSQSLSNDHVRYTYEDAAGRIWIGAGNIIDLWDPDTRSFTHYPNPEFDKAIFADPIGSDTTGRIWVRFVWEGVSILNPSTGIYTNFDGSDGIMDNDMESLPDGRIILVGWAGINIFNPDSIDLKRTPPPLVLTRMAINDEPIAPPSLVKGLNLTFTQNVLEFEFAAIDIDAPQLVKYQYQLEGLEKDWVSPQDRRYVRYPGLDPGDYVFRVKATSIRNAWPEQEIALAISIAPPWYRTTWAYISYIFIFIGLLITSYQLRLKQFRLKQQMEIDHFQATHLAELDQLKSRFFANISHEFRTPLTLILGPIEKFRTKLIDVDSQRSLSMMERNAHQLLRLINQLLDLSKLEAGAMKLQACLGNIVPVIKGVAYSFESSAGLRKIELNISIVEEDIQIYFDKDKVENILTNLLANAFKFTPDGGKIGVQVQFLQPPLSPFSKGDKLISPLSRGDEGGCLRIIVSDTGVGIPADKLPHIFDRFYQVDSSSTRQQGGTGIGLALVKELVEMHHGTISVDSKPGIKTEFTVSIPGGRESFKPDEIVKGRFEDEPTSMIEEEKVERTTTPTESGTVSGQQSGKPIILVVEDNADVRQYIRENLPDSYQVMEASDGSAGIEKARETIPDLIISDVMMPRQDGYELCRILKNDEKTSHIPIILLTAKAASENKIEGLQTGADDYLIKPFEPKELVVRVSNLIELRRKLRKRFETSVPLRVGEVAVTSMDDVFLKKVLKVVEGNLSDEDFHVDELSNELGMSRVQLYRKIIALTNLSPWEFICYIRLHRAMELLQKGTGTVSEIAYQVGFHDPSYFSKCFHKQFGKSPMEVKKSAEK
jgi:signal transduction histidine kinase/DNA-binding response OmpR family regulator/ligand-binding sensor domain-containing protein